MAESAVGKAWASLSLFFQLFGDDLFEDAQAECEAPVLAALTAIRELGAQPHSADAAARLGAEADTVLATTEPQMKAGWAHVCYRELHVLALLCKGLSGAEAAPQAAARHVDVAIILGAPQPVTDAVIALLNPLCAAAYSAPGTGGFAFISAADAAAAVEAAGGDADAAVAKLCAGLPHAGYPFPPTGAASTAAPIARADGASTSAAEFKKLYYSKEKPVVVTGEPSVAAWPALTKWGDVQALCGEVGWRTVPAEVGCKRHPERCREGEGAWREEAVTLGEFLAGRVAGRGVDGPPAYLAQHGLLDQLPEMARDVGMPAILDAVAGDPEEVTRHCWIGTADTITELHCDSYDNFFVQLYGYKYIRLYAPKHARSLYVARRSSKNAHTAQGNCSTMPCEEEGDFEAYPLARDVPYQEVLLGPGEGLFIPEGWFHYLRAVTPSVSVNHWF
eukprot:Rhum_TRINITY_DN12471_c0_g1::Rhum_TRINITY_DN12471_c0_g1_i1::g.52104::m.52104/K10277/KDM8, JMJD5; lysine-specific demethylase 8